MINGNFILTEKISQNMLLDILYTINQIDILWPSIPLGRMDIQQIINNLIRWIIVHL